MPRPARRFVFLLSALFLGATSLFCLAVSVWAHVTALRGQDPRLVWDSIWILEPSLVIVLLPIGVIAMKRGVKVDPFGLSRPVWRLQFALLVYYGLQFYLFLYRAQSVLRADYTWQMFSAGWILLFTLGSAVYLNFARRHRRSLSLSCRSHS